MISAITISMDELADLPAIADQLLEIAGDRRVWLFHGEMGVGKTTLIKALCAALGVTDSTSSPTFSIVNEYDSPNGAIYHFDFYRIRSAEEALDLGYEEYFYSGNYCFVEWPQKIDPLLPPDALAIELQLRPDGGRILRLGDK